MTEENSISFNSTCRACLKTGTRMYSLTETIVNLEVSIASMLEFCNAKKLVLNENLPNNVCLSCYKMIRMSYQFFKSFEEVQQQLLSLQDTYLKSHEETLLIEVETDQSVQEDSDENEKTDYLEEDMEQTNFSEHLELQDENSLASNIEIVVDETKMESVGRRGSHRTPFICPICKNTFSRQNSFESHILFIHNSLDKITCTKCPTRPKYHDRSEYFKHYVKLHKYECNICNISLDGNGSFYYHRRQHENKYSPLKNSRHSYKMLPTMLGHIQQQQKLCDLLQLEERKMK